MTNESKNCQSCGMPLKRDAKGGGTNADGSIANCIVPTATRMENSFIKEMM